MAGTGMVVVRMRAMDDGCDTLKRQRNTAGDEWAVLMVQNTSTSQVSTCAGSTVDRITRQNSAYVVNKGEGAVGCGVPAVCVSTVRGHEVRAAKPKVDHRSVGSCDMERERVREREMMMMMMSV